MKKKILITISVTVVLVVCMFAYANSIRPFGNPRLQSDDFISLKLDHFQKTDSLKVLSELHSIKGVKIAVVNAGTQYAGICFRDKEISFDEVVESVKSLGIAVTVNNCVSKCPVASVRSLKFKYRQLFSFLDQGNYQQ